MRTGGGRALTAAAGDKYAEEDGEEEVEMLGYMDVVAADGTMGGAAAAAGGGGGVTTVTAVPAADGQSVVLVGRGGVSGDERTTRMDRLVK